MQSASRFGVLGKPPQAGVHINPSENPPRATCTMPSAAQRAPHGQGHGPTARGTAGTRGKRDRVGNPQGPTPEPWGGDKAQPWGQGPAAPSRRLCPSTDTGQRPGAGRGTSGSSVPHSIPPPQAEGLGTLGGSGAAIKVQLRFFAFGTMATFPTWLNYRAGCCLCRGVGGVCLFAGPQSQGCRTGADRNPRAPTGARGSLPGPRGASSQSNSGAWPS